MPVHLFDPIQLEGLKLPNRIIIAPMCQYSADEGTATDWHTIHLGHLALSGAGLLVIEATAVEADGPDLAARSRALVRRERARARPRARVRAQARDDADRHPAGACRPQGLASRAVGRRHADQGRRRRLDHARAFRGSVSAGHRGAARARQGRSRAGEGRVPQGRRTLRASGARCDRDPQRPRLPAARIPLAARPTSATTSTAARSPIACAFRWRCSRRCARWCRRTCRSACASPRPTISRAAGTSSRRSPTRMN